MFQVFTPIDCAFLPKGVLAVSESSNQRIQLFDNKGASLGTIGEGMIKPKGRSFVDLNLSVQYSMLNFFS